MLTNKFGSPIRYGTVDVIRHTHPSVSILVEIFEVKQVTTSHRPGSLKRSSSISNKFDKVSAAQHHELDTLQFPAQLYPAEKW
jgi:hypothetical protein